MTDRIDPMGHHMQSADRKAMVNGVLAKSQLQQLPPRHRPVLSLRQPRHDSVGMHASPPQPGYIAG
jgi:hypothetical protein